MDAVWRLGEATAEQVREALPEPLHDSSVRTLLRVLESKGYLGHEVRGKAYVYRAAVERKKAQRRALRSVLARFFGGSAEDLVLRLIEDERITPEQLERAAPDGPRAAEAGCGPSAARGQEDGRTTMIDPFGSTILGARAALVALDVALKATALMAMAFACHGVLGRRRALIRSALWNAGLVGLLLLPAASLAFPRLRITVPAMRAADRLEGAVPIPHLPITEAALPEAIRSVRPRTIDRDAVTPFETLTLAGRAPVDTASEPIARPGRRLGGAGPRLRHLSGSGVPAGNPAGRILGRRRAAEAAVPGGRGSAVGGGPGPLAEPPRHRAARAAAGDGPDLGPRHGRLAPPGDHLARGAGRRGEPRPGRRGALA